MGQRELSHSANKDAPGTRRSPRRLLAARGALAQGVNYRRKQERRGCTGRLAPGCSSSPRRGLKGMQLKSTGLFKPDLTPEQPVTSNPVGGESTGSPPRTITPRI